MFSNERNVKNFTDSLYELFVEQKLTLVKSLEIIANEKQSKVQKAADRIKTDLQQGCTFSNALQTCSFLDFDQIYISFVSFAEITGNLQQTLEFLKKRCERKEQSNTKLTEASLYPSFVIIFAIGLCIFLGFYTSSLYGTESFNSFISQKNLFSSVLLLLSFCFVIFAMIKKNLQENKMYESFLAISFLIKSGVNVSVAVGAGIIITGPGSKYGALFQSAKEKLEFGMDVFNAFDCFSLRPELKNAFYYAQMAGNKSDVFEKIATRMGVEDEKRRRKCLALIEPVFIGITGMFLMIVLVLYLMPMMTDTSWIK